MSETKIDKGVPVPKDHWGIRYPFKDMAVNDSFHTDKPQLPSMANRMYAPKRFISRKENDGYRVWRIK